MEPEVGIPILRQLYRNYLNLSFQTITTRLKWQPACFRNPDFQANNWEYCATNAEVGNSRWRDLSALQIGSTYVSASRQDSNAISAATSATALHASSGMYTYGE